MLRHFVDRLKLLLGARWLPSWSAIPDVVVHVRNPDQIAPQVYIESPANGAEWTGDIDVRGAVLPGWSAAVEEIAVPIDQQRQFTAKVGAPTGKALAIRLPIPSAGFTIICVGQSKRTRGICIHFWHTRPPHSSPLAAHHSPILDASDASRQAPGPASAAPSWRARASRLLEGRRSMRETRQVSYQARAEARRR